MKILFAHQPLISAKFFATVFLVFLLISFAPITVLAQDQLPQPVNNLPPLTNNSLPPLTSSSFQEAYAAGSTAAKEQRWQDSLNYFITAFSLTQTAQERLYTSKWIEYVNNQINSSSSVITPTPTEEPEKELYFASDLPEPLGLTEKQVIAKYGSPNRVMHEDHGILQYVYSDYNYTINGTMQYPSECIDFQNGQASQDLTLLSGDINEPEGFPLFSSYLSKSKIERNKEIKSLKVFKIKKRMLTDNEKTLLQVGELSPIEFRREVFYMKHKNYGIIFTAYAVPTRNYDPDSQNYKFKEPSIEGCHVTYVSYFVNGAYDPEKSLLKGDFGEVGLSVQVVPTPTPGMIPVTIKVGSPRSVSVVIEEETGTGLAYGNPITIIPVSGQAATVINLESDQYKDYYVESKDSNGNYLPFEFMISQPNSNSIVGEVEPSSFCYFAEVYIQAGIKINRSVGKCPQIQ